MGATETDTSLSETVTEQPSIVLAGLFGLYLVVDLLTRLVGVSVDLGGVKLIGGTLAVSRLLTYLYDGFMLGLVIGLAGVGLSMTYSILNFANFAHGDYITTGAFSGWFGAYVVAFLTLNVDFPLPEVLLLNAPSMVSILKTPLAIVVGMIVAGLVTIAVALALDRIVYRPMRDKEGITLLIASIGVALALRYAIVFIFATNTRGLTAALTPYNVQVIDGAVNVDLHELTLAVSAISLMLGVHFLLQRTKLGKAMRAMADNKDLAQVTGIPTERVIRATWIIGGGLAGIAGFLIVLERGTLNFNLGWRLLLLIFSGVILGGIGSVYGAIGGGIIIGIAARLSLVWIPSDFARAAAFAVMILVLLYRPEGLFGGVTTA